MFMFDEIGKKIKAIAKILCWVGIASSIITAIVMFIKAGKPFSADELYKWLGWIFLIIGPISSIIFSFVLYGFGELIDETFQISANLRIIRSENSTSKKIETLTQWKEQGLITEEEYKEKVKQYDKR